MKKIIGIIGLFLLGILLLSSTASAWGPHTHTYLTEKLFDDPKGIIAQYADYEAQFLAGSMVPDITVAYYFAEGGAKYRATHNWNFQHKIMQEAQTPDEIAFAYGVASHMISDSISHTMCIPERIRAYHIPNWLIHPLTEKKYDSLLAQDHLGLKDRSKHMMDAILKGESHLLEGETLAQHNAKVDRYIEMIENALDDEGFDVEENLVRLGFALDSFYKDGKRPEGGGIFALYPVIDSLTDLVYPLSTGSMDQVDFYVKKAYTENENIFATSTNWGTRVQLKPAGYAALNAADAEAVNVFTLLLFGYIFMMLGLPIFLFWWRRDPRMLIFIPVMLFFLILVVMLIYIII